MLFRSKYCTNKCAVIHHRMDKAEGKIKIPKPPPIKEWWTGGAKDVYLFIKNHYDVHGKRLSILEELRNVKIGKFWVYYGKNQSKKTLDIFLRISANKWKKSPKFTNCFKEK